MKRLFKSYLWMVLMGSLAWVSCSDKEVGGTAGAAFDPSCNAPPTGARLRHCVD